MLLALPGTRVPPTLPKVFFKFFISLCFFSRKTLLHFFSLPLYAHLFSFFPSFQSSPLFFFPPYLPYFTLISGSEEYSTGTIKRSSRESPSASSLRKYAIQNNTSVSSTSGVQPNSNNNNNSMQKTESSLSINSVDRMMGSMSDTLSKAHRYINNKINFIKESVVVTV